MKCEKILEIIDGKHFFELDSSEHGIIQEHCRRCDGCRHSFDAARVAALMLEARASKGVETQPSPFFNSVVMNAIRAQASRRTGGEAFRRWWQASYSLVSVMVLLVLFLIAGAALAPAEETEASVATPSTLYPTETVLIDHRPSRDLNKEQVFQVIYNTRYEAKK